MYAAVIKMGWITDCFEGETPFDIIRGASRYQDFDCLLRMGWQNEPASNHGELRKLEAFINKFYDNTLTFEDVAGLDIRLSIGDITCLGVAEGDEAIAALKAKYNCK